MSNIESLSGVNNYEKVSTSLLRVFRDALKTSEEAQRFLRLDKNLTDDTIKHFTIGYDIYRDNITIPEIRSKQFVNIAYRSLDQNVKNKYTKQKGCLNWIFNEDGINVAKEMGGILIVSNQFDAMSAWQVGIKNVVSIPVGKSGVGEWMELFDNIPKIYISFESNKKLRKFGLEFADRVGVDKCFEVQLPEDIIDLTAYFKVKTKEDFKQLIRDAKPFYKYTYKDLVSILDEISDKGDSRLSIDIVPYIKLDIDYLIMISGLPGVGKSSYAMNIAKRLIDLDIPVLVVPYERGARTLGQRFLAIKFNKPEDEIMTLSQEGVKEMKEQVINTPLYFSVPEQMEMRKTVERAKKLFGVKAVIIDHLEYNVHTGSSNSSDNDKLKMVMTEWKNICIDLGVMFFVVHHVRKGGVGALKRELTMEDMVGGGTTQRVAEAVLMLSETENENEIKVNVVKNNHGRKDYKVYEFEGVTGVLGQEVDNKTQAEQDFNEF